MPPRNRQPDPSLKKRNKTYVNFSVARLPTPEPMNQNHTVSIDPTFYDAAMRYLGNYLCSGMARISIACGGYAEGPGKTYLHAAQAND